MIRRAFLALLLSSTEIVEAQNIGKPLVRTKQGIFTCVHEESDSTGKTLGFDRRACYGNFLKDVDVETHDPFNAELTCRSYCTDSPCLGLFGNRTQECGACGPAAKCHPAANDWHKLAADPADLNCMDHCEKNECILLSGNPAYECAGCTAETAKCHPGADNYSDYLERKKARTEL